jgi:transcription elongation factor Elf1
MDITISEGHNCSITNKTIKRGEPAIIPQEGAIIKPTEIDDIREILEGVLSNRNSTPQIEIRGDDCSICDREKIVASIKTNPIRFNYNICGSCLDSFIEEITELKSTIDNTVYKWWEPGISIVNTEVLSTTTDFIDGELIRKESDNYTLRLGVNVTSSVLTKIENIREVKELLLNPMKYDSSKSVFENGTITCSICGETEHKPEWTVIKSGTRSSHICPECRLHIERLIDDFVQEEKIFISSRAI